VKRVIDMKTVVVTGCSGYVGQHVVQRLVDENYAVTGIDIKDFPGKGLPNVTFFKGDIVDRDFVVQSCSGADAVVHCAAALAQFVKDTDRMYAINVTGTRNVIEACQKHTIQQLVFVSSVEVYGIDVPVPCPEDVPLCPVCPYGEHKVIGEQMCIGLAEKGHGVAILRPPTINGPGQNEPFLVEQMKAVREGKPVILPGGGKTRLQMVDVRDVAQAIVLSLHKITKGVLVANISSDNVPTIRQMVTALFEHAGKKEKILSVPAPVARGIVNILSFFGVSPLEPQHLEIALRDYVFDNSRAKKALGWYPTKNDIESAIDAYEWFINN